jgi:phosphoribosylaminoimidazole-succinocarboxamide synthase
MDYDVKTVVVDGMDGSGKTTLIQRLVDKYKGKITFKDRGILTNLTLSHWDLWKQPNDLERDWDFYIILETDLEEAKKRLASREKEKNLKKDKWETDVNLFTFRYRFRNLAAFYGNIHLIDTTNLSVEMVEKELEDIIFNNSKKNIVPSVNSFTEEDFQNLPFIIEGESKIVREFNHRFHIVKYKPTVYSHKMQRAGEVEGTDKERMTMTKNLLDIFSRHMIKHTYWFIGDTYILNETLDNNRDIPPIEVIVKRCFVGSDKHRYYKMDTLKNRFGQDLVKKERNEYQKLLVRFDYRNPNFDPDTGIPIGDILVCDDLADEFINVEVAKPTAKKIFNCLDENFSKMNIYFEDVCLMLTVDGDKLYGEVSQDCGRYKYVKENELTDLDKDVWRAGGSSQLVLQKYQMLSGIVKDYVKNVLYENDRINFAG